MALNLPQLGQRPGRGLIPGFLQPMPESIAEGDTRIDYQMERIHLTKRRVSGGIVVEAPPEAVWACLTAYEQLPEIVPNILSNEVTRHDDGRVSIEQVQLISRRMKLETEMTRGALGAHPLAHRRPRLPRVRGRVHAAAARRRHDLPPLRRRARAVPALPAAARRGQDPPRGAADARLGARRRAAARARRPRAGGRDHLGLGGPPESPPAGWVPATPPSYDGRASPRRRRARPCSRGAPALAPTAPLRAQGPGRATSHP